MPLPSLRKCLICSRPLTRHEHYAGQICSDWRCRARQLEDALRAHRAQAALALGVEQAEAFPIAVIPSRPVRVVELSAERRRVFADFLAELAAALPDKGDEPCADRSPASCAERPTATAPPDPEIEALLAQVCAVCQGFCCFYGATRHAFLDGETMRRLRDCRPGARAADVALAYLRYLPARHCEASCVYHTQGGCALPRAMRARICNTYECRGLKDARRGCGGSAPARACAVVRHDNRIIRCAFVDASGIRREGA